MSVGDEEIGQLGAEAAGGKIGETTDVVEGLVGGAGGDDAIHATEDRTEIRRPKS